MAWRFPWPFRTRTEPAHSVAATSERAPVQRDWASLPTLRGSVGKAPLTARSAEFAHERIDELSPPLALAELGHDRNASGPAGLVSGIATPVVARTLAATEPASPPDRPSALGRFARSALGRGAADSRGPLVAREPATESVEPRTPLSAPFEPAAAASPETEPWSGADAGIPPDTGIPPSSPSDAARGPAGLPETVARPAAVGPLTGELPRRVQRVAAAIGSQRSEQTTSLVRAPDVGVRRDGVLGQPLVPAATLAPPATRENRVGPDPAGNAGTTQRQVQADAGSPSSRSAAPPRLTVGQVRRLGLGTPLPRVDHRPAAFAPSDDIGGLAAQPPSGGALPALQRDSDLGGRGEGLEGPPTGQLSPTPAPGATRPTEEPAHAAADTPASDAISPMQDVMDAVMPADAVTPASPAEDLHAAEAAPFTPGREARIQRAAPPDTRPLVGPGMAAPGMAAVGVATRGTAAQRGADRGTVPGAPAAINSGGSAVPSPGSRAVGSAAVVVAREAGPDVHGRPVERQPGHGPSGAGASTMALAPVVGRTPLTGQATLRGSAPPDSTASPRPLVSPGWAENRQPAPVEATGGELPDRLSAPPPALRLPLVQRALSGVPADGGWDHPTSSGAMATTASAKAGGSGASGILPASGLGEHAGEPFATQSSMAQGSVAQRAVAAAEAPAAVPAAAPEPTSATPAPAAASAPLPTGDRELEELAQGLYERIRSRLRLELLVDRERSGMLSDLT